MTVTSAKYIEGGAIAAVIDGVSLAVPDDAGNRHRQEIAVWEADGNTIAAADPAEAPRRLVPKSLIIARLAAAGLFDAAHAALEADTFAYARFYAPDRPALYADDAETRLFLTAIGADPDTILAP